MINFNSFSIRIKLSLLLSITSAIALFISSITFFYYIYNSEKESYINSLTQLAMISSENIKPAIMFMDNASANNIIAPFNMNKNILSAKVYDEAINLFASYNSKELNGYEIEEINKHSNKIIEKFKKSLTQEREIVKVVEWDRIFVLVPIILDNQFIGLFVVASNTKLLKENLINLTLIQTIIIISTLLLITYLSTKLQRIFTKPIFKLVKVMNQVSKTKEYDITIDLNRSDEFKNLNDGFNSMIKEINSRDYELNNLIDKLEVAKREVEEIHTQLKDSINYASLIQQTIMPKDDSFERYFRDFFIMWEPRDVVGGDIYLFEELPNKRGCILMVIDCTGHGVAGAFVTMLTKAIEREIVSKIINKNIEVSTAEILSIFNKSIKHLLRQDSGDTISNAGFDGGVLYYDREKAILKYSGANTPLFIVQNEKLEVIKGCRHSVGYKRSNVNYKFKEHTIDVSKDSYIYLSTDGYLDQIGGDRKFTFGKNRFKKVIRENFDKTFSSQKRIFQKSISEYRGENMKVDDITVIGLKI